MPEPSAPEPATPTGRARLWQALRQPSRAQLVVAVLLAALAFAAITQVRTTEVDDSYAGYREQDLIDVLSGLSGTSQRAQAEIRRLEEARDDLLSDTSRRQAALSAAEEEAEALAVLAGYVPVTGPGIRVTITEVDATIGSQILVDMVQELRTAGAEAMQVNGQVRLVAQSFFEDAVGGVVVDGQLLSAPFVFDVIGEPHNLTGGLTFPGGPREQVQRSGGTLEFDERGSIDIESVREPQQPEYAQPQPEQ